MLLAAEGLHAFGPRLQPADRAVDDVEGGLVAALRVVAPGEEAVALEHAALRLRVLAREPLQPQAELVARPLPRQPADLVAEDLGRQRLRVLRRGKGDDRIGVHVIDMAAGHIGMERRVDRRRPRVQVEGAVGQVAHHLVLVLDAAIEALQRLELRHDERREAVELHRADVAARALDPQHLDGLAGQRVLLRHLGRGVAPAVVGDPLVRAEQVRAIEEELRLRHARRARVVPETRQPAPVLDIEHRVLPRSAPLRARRDSRAALSESQSTSLITALVRCSMNRR